MFQKIIFILPILACILATVEADYFPYGERELHGDDAILAVAWLKENLGRLPEIGGPYYRVVDVSNVTRIEFADGYTNRYITVLKSIKGISRNCKVWIYHPTVIRQGMDVKISCEGLEEYEGHLYWLE